MRVLITNYVLATRSGSELYVRDIASALLARGHSPVVYAPVLGPLAGEIRSLTIPVVDDLRNISAAPDLIHGHHNQEIIAALLRFPGVPAIRFCHGWFDERPHQFPRIVRYVAVDDTVRDRMVSEWGLPEERVRVLYNFVDLASFPRRAALPSRPARAIVFSNSASEHLRAIREGCSSRGIAVDSLGADVGRAHSAPGAVLRDYDVVFAKGRCAIEALAVGAAVVVCDRAGLGPLVTTGNFDELRRLNFGVRTLREPVDASRIARALDGYDAADAAVVSDRLRSVAALDTAIDVLVELYEDAIEQLRASPVASLEDELRSASEYLQSSTRDPSLKAATAVWLRALYFRCERGALLRHVMPSRPFARRMRKLMGGA